MMIDKELLEILVCPEDKTPVKLADVDLLSRMNKAIAANKVKNRGGENVSQALEGGLVRQDDKWLYPIRDEIPVMLMDEALPLPPPEG